MSAPTILHSNDAASVKARALGLGWRKRRVWGFWVVVCLGVVLV